MSLIRQVCRVGGEAKNLLEAFWCGGFGANHG